MIEDVTGTLSSDRNKKGGASLIFNVNSNYSLYCQYYDTLVYSSRQDTGKDHIAKDNREPSKQSIDVELVRTAFSVSERDPNKSVEREEMYYPREDKDLS